MKKIISFKEFTDYYAKNKPNLIIYYSENQKWYQTSDPCKLKMAFPIMLIHENPNLVCLKSDNNTLSFDRVKNVEVDTESCVLGTIVTLYCGEFGTKGHDVTYTLIAE